MKNKPPRKPNLPIKPTPHAGQSMPPDGAHPGGTIRAEPPEVKPATVAGSHPAPSPPTTDSCVNAEIQAPVKAAETLLEDERIFLTYQIELRGKGTPLLNEAMLVLDIIDSKTQALLAYISISLAALVFLLTSPPTAFNARLVLLTARLFSTSLLVIILALLGAIILCLSCLNIVGGHTMRSRGTRRKLTQQGYEDLIVRVTAGRRNRYLLAHRISVVTAVVTFILFLLLLAGFSLGDAGQTMLGPSQILTSQPKASSNRHE